MRSTMLRRRDLLKTMAIGAGGVAMARALRAAESAGARRPNVIFVLTDDLGWGDPKSYGHPYMKTPALDRLAREGTSFTQFYVNNPVCSPSRTAFMTGHFPARHRVHQHFAHPKQNKARGMPDWLDPDVVTVTDMMKKAGYTTAHFGKWHLTNSHSADAPSPSAYGIDDHRTVNSSGPGWANKTPYFRAKSTGLFVDETIRFMKKVKGKPFFVNLWTLVPHATLKPTPQELKVYEDLAVDKGRFQSYMRTYLHKAPRMLSQMKVYCAAVTGMDKALGRLLKALDEMGLADNTLIFFTSDNGPEDYHVGNARNAGVGSPGAFRGRKRSIYEGGVRTSCIVRWPGRVPAGRVDDESVLTGVDFLPTMCKLAGVAAGDIQPDGEDVSDVLLGKSRPRRKPIMWEWRGGVAGDRTYAPPKLAVRQGRWKLLVNPDGSRVELYDIPNDPGERKNLAKERGDLAGRLSKQVLAWKKTLPK